MTAFHEVRFPLRLALATSGGPVRRTEIVNLSNGRENRNARWRDSRRSYDAGSAIKSVSDLYAVLEFFEARRGRLHGFRFRDPLDGKSCAPAAAVSAIDQRIGLGDGQTTTFPLAKTYGDVGGSWVRRIAKPVASSVLVSVDGVEMTPDAYTVDVVAGIVTFAAGDIPAAGTEVAAGFEFDVPVRFDMDRLDVDLTHFDAGRIPTIPLTEILP